MISQVRSDKIGLQSCSPHHSRNQGKSCQVYTAYAAAAAASMTKYYMYTDQMHQFRQQYTRPVDDSLVHNNFV